MAVAIRQSSTLGLSGHCGEFLISDHARVRLGGVGPFGAMRDEVGKFRIE
jgi:hypothetical protein